MNSPKNPYNTNLTLAINQIHLKLVEKADDLDLLLTVETNAKKANTLTGKLDEKTI